MALNMFDAAIAIMAESQQSLADIDRTRICSLNGACFSTALKTSDKVVDIKKKIATMISEMFTQDFVAENNLINSVDKLTNASYNEMKSQCVICMRRIRRLRELPLSKKILFRFELKDKNINILILARNPEEPKPSEFIIYMYTALKSCVTVMPIYINTALDKVTPAFNSLFVYGSGSSFESYIRSEEVGGEECFGLLNNETIQQLAECLKAISNYTENVGLATYSKSEMDMVYNFINIVSEKDTNCIMNHSVYALEGADHDIDHKHIFESYANTPFNGQFELTMLDNDIKFARKYFREKYVDKQICPNLVTALSNPRFGKNYRLYIDDDRFITLSICDVNDDYVTVYAVEHLASGINVIASTKITDPNNWNGWIPVISVDCSIGRKRPNFPVWKKSWLISSDKNNLCELLFNFVLIMLVMHDRPDRYKVIDQLSTKKPSSGYCKEHVAADGSVEYITKHILASKTEAKKYVASHSTGRLNKEARYVLASWDRAGHIRTYKSGKQVYISSTTCTRHKELSEDVKVKLIL